MENLRLIVDVVLIILLTVWIITFTMHKKASVELTEELKKYNENSQKLNPAVFKISGQDFIGVLEKAKESKSVWKSEDGKVKFDLDKGIIEAKK